MILEFQTYKIISDKCNFDIRSWGFVSSVSWRYIRVLSWSTAWADLAPPGTARVEVHVKTKLIKVRILNVGEFPSRLLWVHCFSALRKTDFFTSFIPHWIELVNKQKWDSIIYFQYYIFTPLARKAFLGFVITWVLIRIQSLSRTFVKNISLHIQFFPFFNTFISLVLGGKYLTSWPCINYEPRVYMWSNNQML